MGIKYQEKRDSGFKCKWDGGQIPASVLAAAKGQVVGVREESTLLEPSSANNKRSSRFNSHASGSTNEGGNSNPSSLNISSINTEVTKSESNSAEDNGLYTTPTSAKTTKSTEEPSNNSFSEIPSINANSSKGEMVLMKSVKFKIDILPSDESNPEKKSTKVIFTQQQGKKFIIPKNYNTKIKKLFILIFINQNSIYYLYIPINLYKYRFLFILPSSNI